MKAKPKNLEGGNARRDSALCYVPFLGWMPAVIFLILERDVEVRRSAVQSILAHGLLAGFYWVTVPLLGVTVVLAPLSTVLGGAVGVGYFIASLVAMGRAHAGRKVTWPLITEWTDRILKLK